MTRTGNPSVLVPEPLVPEPAPAPGAAPTVASAVPANVAADVVADAAQARRRELARLRALPKGEAALTPLIEPHLRLLDGPSFVPQYEDIFLREIYDFPHAGSTPTIIDGGANIGLGVIWWRARWPAARVIAFEADPAVFEVLRYNTRHQKSLELRCAALSCPELGDTFIVEGTDAGRLGNPWATSSRGLGTAITVPTVRLRDVIAGLDRVDLLKLDVEGAETALLLDAAPVLDWVDRIFVEYHSFVGQDQRLSELTTLLRDQGFRLFLTAPRAAMRPFRGVPVDRGIDLEANIYAWRPGPVSSPHDQDSAP